MKVLHVIPAVAARYGGPSSAIGPMCLALAHLGAETLLLSTDADGEGHLDVPLGERTEWNGVPALFFRRDASESFKYSRGLARWIRDHARDFDVVHIHAVLSHASLAAARGARQAGVPYVVRPLGTLTEWSLGKKGLKKRTLLRLGARSLLRDAAAIHYTSEEEKRDSERQLGLAPGVVIPLGIDERLLIDRAVDRTVVETEGCRRSPYVLALSRLHPKKNLEAMIQAFVSATAHDVTWRLVIAGDGDPSYVQELKQRAAAVSAGDRVIFAGWVSGEAKHALMRNASLFAIPSFDENFGVALVEALAAGVPALVSRQVNLGRDVSDAGAGWLIDSDVQSIEKGLERAFAECATWTDRGRAARTFAAQFGWPDIAAQLLALYARLQRGARTEQGATVASGVSVSR